MCFYSILDPPENVVLTTNATANKACQNDVVRFNCSADAVPSAMSFQLFKDNVPMEISNSGMWVKTLSEGGMFDYKCVANNSIGSASSTINVNITVNAKWDRKNTLVLMLTLTNDLTDSSYARSVYNYSATSAFNEAHQWHHERKHVITERLYAISFLNQIDACRLVPGRFPSWFRLFYATKVY